MREKGGGGGGGGRREGERRGRGREKGGVSMYTVARANTHVPIVLI